ncbi:Gfo/Idh/MocA family oxidoreductase [Kribbella solani]|uniref:Gfo/Idh/MocA family protein n=1 Tax=Kribbella solani TaxID=236067 RepID=UPI0029BF1070|nr:Gfo/Idh/MocA family oxidoreductase [Kribbella solani]MDX2971732.1 Gfo/Idh/MocA family oxidoreductase [Kribbella solani]MDX3005506.1 Gfo/Idh/MocA family oxidoreductase [Kribbella solani]
MTRIAIAGAAHPHVAYATTEVDERDDVQLVAVSDPDRTTAERWATPYEAKVFTDHRQLLDEARPDVVMVAGIYSDRGQVVVDALDAGAHVIADKPLCTTLADLDAIAAAVRRTGRHVTVLLEKRYYPVTLAALEIVRSGQLGTIHGVTSSGPHKLNRPTRPAWFFDRARYGGLLNDLSVHDLDAALLFTGLTGGTVSGSLAGDPAWPRYGAATLSGPGVLITAGVDWLTPAGSPVHGDYRMKLVGTEGTAELLWARNRLKLTTTDLAPHDVPLPKGFRAAELPIQTLAEGNELDITTAQSLLVTRLALLAQQSAESDCIPLPWATDDPNRP